jgi:putative phosphoserine phosphatase/1-acylglycerol-3-phosphate O-acyltransferase
VTSTAELVDRIEAAPEGPSTLAVFDYDGTLIDGFSAADFYRDRLKNRQMGPAEIAELVAAARKGLKDAESFIAFMDSSLARWAGLSEAELFATGESLFKHETAGRLRRETYELLETHRKKGHTLVLASSALPFQTQPIARALEFDHVLCTAVEVGEDGLLTGRTDGVPVWGPEKARKIVELAEELGYDADDAFGYSNGGEDVPMLQACGTSAAIAPDDDLVRAAAREGWPVLQCADPTPRATVKDAVRTAAFYGSFAGAMGVAGSIGIVRRSRRSFLDLAFGVGADVSLAAAGVDVRVLQGAEHLWDSRPCLFVFNHSSKIDTIVVAKLLRQDFTGVAKAEAKNVPMFGQLFQLAGIALIDRGDRNAAQAKMQPLVQKLREGTSVVVSPEGTRTATPRMAPFKKGPFHIAMQAEVPVVPIVFRGIDQVQWRGAQVIRPGVVEAVVLPPVSTTDWAPETVAEHRDEVRALMQAQLDRWPTSPHVHLPVGGAA